MPGRRFLIALCGVFFLVVLIRTAWLSELSYLTLRTIEHAATGHGLRWNISERVQVFDHPLWMLLLLAGRFITGESYYTTLIVSIGLSAATAVLVLRSARAQEGFLLGTAFLSLSWAFVTFSTSGLEGPLSHLLVMSFCLAWIRVEEGNADGRTMAGLAGAAALTHIATVFITAPALMSVIRRRRRLAAASLDEGAGAIGFKSPMARLKSGPTQSRKAGLHGRGRRLQQCRARARADTTRRARGVEMIPTHTARVGGAARLDRLRDVLLRLAGADARHRGMDRARWPRRPAAGGRPGARVRPPRTIRITLAIVAAAVTSHRRSPACSTARVRRWSRTSSFSPSWAGDGTPSRWLALPCLVSTFVVVRHPLLNALPVVAAAVAVTVALAAVPTLAPIQSDVRFGTSTQFTDPRDSRVADYPATGFLHDIRQWYPPHHPEATRGGVAWQDTNRVKTSPHPAFFGFAAGYGVHVIDRSGRADPLLARIRPEERSTFPSAPHAAFPTGTRRHYQTGTTPFAILGWPRTTTRSAWSRGGRWAIHGGSIAALRLAFVSAPGVTTGLADTGDKGQGRTAGGPHARTVDPPELKARISGAHIPIVGPPELTFRLDEELVRHETAALSLHGSAIGR